MSKIGRWTDVLPRKLTRLFQRKRFRSELQEEMEFHKAQAEQDFENSGMTPQAARYAAARQFGNFLRLRELSQETVQFRIESVWQDVQFAARQMLRSPGFTASVVLTMALGIGANTAIFSVVHATLLRNLPYPDADRIVRVEDVALKGNSAGGLTGVPRFFDLKARSQSFNSVALMYFDTPTLIANGRLPELVKSAAVSGQFWRVFGAEPMLGRVFDEREDRADAAGVVVLSYSAWRRMFGGDPSIVGKVVTIDRHSTTIVGVMPQSFSYASKVDVWRPAQLEPANWSTYRGDGSRWANVFARLKPGVSQAAAQNELQLLASRLAAEHPQTDAPWRFRILPLREFLSEDLKPALLVLMAASAVLLLIACLNVGNLLLSRATSREREMALRQALGASSRRIARQLLTESTVLAILGGCVGFALANGIIRVLSGWQSSPVPTVLKVEGSVSAEWPVIVFVSAIILLTSILLGLIPAFGVRRAHLNDSLKRRETRLAGVNGGSLRNVFISLQVGLSLVLMIIACLLVQSLWKLTQTPLGFAPDHVLTFGLKLPWNTDPATVDTFYKEIQNRLSGLPSVLAVGQVSSLPTEAFNLRTSSDVDWKPRTEHKDAISYQTQTIAGHYLQAMRIPLLAGRELREKESALLVNRKFVQQFMPGIPPLGKHILQTGPKGDSQPWEIVGIVGNVRGTGGSISQVELPEVYEVANQYQVGRSFAIRSALPPQQLIGEVRGVVHEVDPQQALGNLQTLDDLLTVDTAQPRLNMALLVAFAGIALLLACVGIYGVVAYSVAQRRQEIGVRMALGATRAQIIQLFLERTGWPATIGIVAGAAAALLVTRLLRSQLYGIDPNDPRTFAIAILLLMIPVFLASLHPALKAASVDPVEALRAE